MLQDVQPELVSAWLDHLTAQSRAAQLLPKDSPLLTTLEETMSRYLKDVRRSTVKTDKRWDINVDFNGLWCRHLQLYMKDCIHVHTE